jgi:hypothetical protein
MENLKRHLFLKKQYPGTRAVYKQIAVEHLELHRYFALLQRTRQQFTMSEAPPIRVDGRGIHFKEKVAAGTYISPSHHAKVWRKTAEDLPT